MLAVKLLLGYPGVRPTFSKRRGRVVGGCLLDRAVCNSESFSSRVPVKYGEACGVPRSNCPACVPLRWERGRVNECIRKGPANHGRRSHKQHVGYGNLCLGQHVVYAVCSTSALLTPSSVRETRGAALLGHSSLVALCLRVFSQEGLRYFHQQHLVACAGIRLSKPGRE